MLQHALFIRPSSFACRSLFGIPTDYRPCPFDSLKPRRLTTEQTGPASADVAKMQKAHYLGWREQKKTDLSKELAVCCPYFKLFVCLFVWFMGSGEMLWHCRNKEGHTPPRAKPCKVQDPESRPFRSFLCPAPMKTGILALVHVLLGQAASERTYPAVLSADAIVPTHTCPGSVGRV